MTASRIAEAKMSTNLTCELWLITTLAIMLYNHHLYCYSTVWMPEFLLSLVSVCYEKYFISIFVSLPDSSVLTRFQTILRS